MENRIAKELLDFRTVHDLTLKTVAEKSGLAYPTICNIEIGKPLSRLTESKLRRFMENYGKD